MPLAFITGGSRGLGFETARQLRDRGFDLVLFAKDTDRLSHASKQLGAKYELFDAENADRKSTRLNSSHMSESRMPSSA